MELIILLIMENEEHDSIIRERDRNAMIHMNKVCLSLGSNTGIASSYPEELLNKLLIQLDDKVVRGRDCAVPKDNGHYYYPDFYSPKYNILIECDGVNKFEVQSDKSLKLNKFYIDRHNYIIDKTKLHMLHVPSDKVFYYEHNILELEKLIKDELSKPLVHL